MNTAIQCIISPEKNMIFVNISTLTKNWFEASLTGRLKRQSESYIHTLLHNNLRKNAKILSVKAEYIV